VGRGKSILEDEMKKEWRQRMQQISKGITAAGMAAAVAGITAGHTLQQKGGMDTATTNAEGKFHCNIKALTPAEWARHRELGEKMKVARTAIVETEKGYELQFSPDKISVGEVAEWVVAESKCCPFFDFHIDLENRGTLVCLRLTGSEGVKAFIRSEFHM
jgi:hypothetical protein